MAEFSDREFSDTICLFDVDNTLTPAMRNIEIEMVQVLTKLRERCVIGFLGGSNLVKITNQLGGSLDLMLNSFDYSFAENGLTAFRLGKPIETQSFINFLGEDRYKKLVNFCLHYIADIDIPIKRGTFIEYRTGMINISPIGRNASIEERNMFENYDKKFNIRRTFVEKLKQEFPNCGLTFSIGGQISFDVFPTGWDKTYALRHIEADKFKTIHFFGDKTFEGGNDYEIYSHPATIGHSVTGPRDTIKQIRDLFKI